MQLLRPEPGGVYLDATLGAGGHAEAILTASAPDGRLIGCDADAEALARAGERLHRFGGRLELVKARFDELSGISCTRSWPRFAGVLADLGLSSPQLDDPARGFSFMYDGPLDMRLDRGQPLSAADLVNSADQGELARILVEYGEERHAARLARTLVEERRAGRIDSTLQLATIVRRVVPHRPGPQRIDPATRTFQALRIAVNDELGCLERFLEHCPDLLAPGGRVAVIAFHSLEDRLVKRAFARLSADCVCPPGVPVCRCGHRPSLRLVTRKPVRPDEPEAAANPRSRSARLRCAERLDGPEAA